MNKKHTKEKHYTNKGTTNTTQPGLLGFASSKLAPPMAPSCDHWRDPVKVGQYTVYASSSRALTDENLALQPYPDMSFYVDRGWLWKLTAFAGIGYNVEAWRWPFLVADWPDMSVMEDSETDYLVAEAVKWVVADKRVEIACIGGHGRTGTLLAMLKVKLEGMSAHDAIIAVRASYCKKTVESISQIEEVYRVAGEDKGSIPKSLKPSKSYGSYGGGYLGWEGGGFDYSYAPTKSTDCEVCDHGYVAHERMEEFKGLPSYKKDGCAFGHWPDGHNATKEWCGCEGYIGFADTSLEEDWWDKYPNDVCECDHERVEHLVEKGWCKARTDGAICRCVSFRIDWDKSPGLEATKGGDSAKITQ